MINVTVLMVCAYVTMSVFTCDANHNRHVEGILYKYISNRVIDISSFQLLGSDSVDGFAVSREIDYKRRIKSCCLKFSCDCEGRCFQFHIIYLFCQKEWEHVWII